MGKQVNLYLQAQDIKKIEQYLQTQNVIFIAQEATPKPKPVYIPFLFSLENEDWARFITLADAHLSYMEGEIEGEIRYQIQSTDTEAMTFSYFGDKAGFHRIRFYYNPYYFEDVEPKHPMLDNFVNDFFEWLKTQFEPVADMPDFYQNPASPVEVCF